MLAEVNFYINPLDEGGFYFMKISVREMTETAMLIGLAIVLDLPFLKFRIGINGGSVSLTMVPLFILALRVGPIKSFIYIAIIYSFLECLIDGEPLYSLPFDYCLAYGSIALTGCFRKLILTEKVTFKGILFLVLSVVVCGALRILSSSISSVLFYEVTYLAGIIYNATYIGPACALTLVVLLLLYKPLIDVNKRYPLKSI